LDLLAGPGLMGGEVTNDECVIDSRPTDGAVLCGGCVAKLVTRLGYVPSLVEELEVTITKQDRVGGRGGGGGQSFEPPSPFNERASDVRTQLRDRLSSWARAVAEHSGGVVPYTPDARGTAVLAARWLAEHPWSVAGYPAAGDLFEEVSDDVRAAFQCIDRPPLATFAGRCDCGGLLYARPGHGLAACRTCGLTYGVQEMREWMLGELEHREGTATEVSAILSAVGIRISYTTIHRWHARGYLGRVDGYRPIYRVGDVAAVATRKSAA